MPARAAAFVFGGGGPAGPGRGARGQPVVDLPEHQGAPRARPGARGPHEETLEAAVGWHLEREHDRIARSRRSQQLQYRVAGPPWARPVAPWACSGAPPVSGPSERHTLGRGHALPLQGAHRPRVPLRPGGAPAATPWGSSSTRCACRSCKRDRPEVEELTGQRWVPVLVLGDEVVHDSHRILEYLDWLGGGRQGSVRAELGGRVTRTRAQRSAHVAGGDDGLGALAEPPAGAAGALQAPGQRVRCSAASEQAARRRSAR